MRTAAVGPQEINPGPCALFAASLDGGRFRPPHQSRGFHFFAVDGAVMVDTESDMDRARRLPPALAWGYGTALVFLAGALVRVCAFVHFPPPTLSRRPELVTPVDGFDRVAEALWLADAGRDPYEGEAFHQPPLVLAVFAEVRRAAENPTVISVKIRRWSFQNSTVIIAKLDGDRCQKIDVEPLAPITVELCTDHRRIPHPFPLKVCT